MPGSRYWIQSSQSRETDGRIYPASAFKGEIKQEISAQWIVEFYYRFSFVSVLHKYLRLPKLVQYSDVFLSKLPLLRLHLLLLLLLSLPLLLSLTKISLQFLSFRETVCDMSPKTASILVAATAVWTGESAVMCRGLPTHPSGLWPIQRGSCKHHRPTITPEINYARGRDKVRSSFKDSFRELFMFIFAWAFSETFSLSLLSLAFIFRLLCASALLF